MREKTQKIANRAVQIIGSRYFFIGIIVIFVLQALWIAFSFRYSMIYDEYYHFGLIQYFSHQWLPWINNQPTSLDMYSALARNPFLLYHYLMSFPFRIVALFTNDFNHQVIAMRLVNIGLFAGGLIVFARLFKEMSIKPAFRNIALLFFVLLPVTPFVAATVNYDNAIFLLSATFLLFGVKIIRSDVLKWQQLIGILTIGMAGSLMKNAFLPIFAAGVVFLFGWVVYKKRKNFPQILKSYRVSSLWWKIGLVVPFLLVGFFFVERFSVNIVQYHAIQPVCESQMSALRCDSGILNRRADQLAEQRVNKVPLQIPSYTSNWASSMIYSLMFTAANTSGKFGTRTAPPLPIVYMVVFIGSIVSFAGFFYGFEKLRQIPGFWFVVAVSAIYLAALFYVDLSAYNSFYEMIAVQGRYLLPLLPAIMVFALLGLNYATRSVRVLKIPILVVVFVLYLNGAGVITHIMRSNDNWNWDNKTVRQVNDGARSLLTPFVKEWWYDK